MLLKNLLFYIPLVSSAIHAVQCTRSSQRSRDTRWPVIYANNEAAPIIYDPSQPLSIYMDLLKDGLFMVSNETELLPVAKSVMNYDQNSEVSKELMFVSALCKTTNCRESLDLWDCPTCKEILPDAIVVRSFKTFPNDVTGHILKSESLKSIFIQVRGANSDRNRVLWSRRQLIEHPFIPDILVSEGYLTSALDVRSIINDTLKDQLILHPDYKVVVAG
ncbi:hypothetical protein G6F56_011808 [Rhizopus delemar]|nr:hypothetical protein G6F56_011808 [Rhizopus delemar]